MDAFYRHTNLDSPRVTARGIIIKGNKILLIERWRDGLHYFSIPGGGVEKDELPKNTVEREVKEETSVDIKIEQPLYVFSDNSGNTHHIFLCNYLQGEASLQPSSEEAVSMQLTNQKDRYLPVWIEVDKLKLINFDYWSPVAKRLVHDLKFGWPNDVIKLQTSN